MRNKDFKNIAKETLIDRWGTVALMTLVYSLCVCVIALAANSLPILGPIIVLILNPVLSFGFLKELLLFKEKKEVGKLDFLKLGFDEFVMIWAVVLRVFLKKIVPFIFSFIGSIGLMASLIIMVIGALTHGSTLDWSNLLLVASLSGLSLLIGFIWSIPLNYKYMFVFNELAYDSNRSAKEIVEISGDYMCGKKWGAFILELSFIGWGLLSVLGLGIPLFWILPYFQLAKIIYYEYASNGSHTKGDVFEELPERTDVTYEEQSPISNG